MSFQYIKDQWKQDKDLPQRAYELSIKRALLDGSFYDVLRYEWDEERNGAGEYVPLKRRKPSVRTGSNLLRAVVEDSASMLFGEGRFPDVICTNEKDTETARHITDLIKETGLAEKMRTAAYRGSIGSVALHLRVLTNRKAQNRAYVDVKDTLHLTPEWDENEPDRLVKITEKYKINAAEARALGVSIGKEDARALFWFQRIYDEASETWFVPWKVERRDDTKPPHVPVVDHDRTITHGLGFCPWVWIKNLHGGDDLDGGCTFKAGVETCLEIDKLASQQARALRYSMDPILVLKEPPGEGLPNDTGAANVITDGVGPVDNASGSGGIIKGPATALTMDAEGDAKYLEIGGSSIAITNDTIEKLRGYALEAMHGSKVNPDQINSHQGAKALEILHAPLVRLTDSLRASYGEYGLLALLRLFVEASKLKTLTVMGRPLPALAEPSELALRWHSWFPETEDDLQKKSITLTSYVEGGLMSHETATEQIAANYGIENVSIEIARIAAEKKAAAALAVEQVLTSNPEKAQQPAKVADTPSPNK